MTVIERLRSADPVRHLPEETGVDDPPPAAVMQRIVATSPPRAVRRSPRLAIVAAALAAAAIAVPLVPADRAGLAARAYAWTPPSSAEDVVHTVVTARVDWHAADAPDQALFVTRRWERGDRAHWTTERVEVGRDGKEVRETAEFDRRGGTLRGLRHDGELMTITAGSAGSQPAGLRSLVDLFRDRYEAADLRDEGETTFAGRLAHAYAADMPDGPDTFYVDPASARLLGVVESSGNATTTSVIERVESLPPTPENLAELDAPRLDAAE